MRHVLFLLTALLLPCWSTTAGAESLGRLFSTPAERVKLDQLRQLGDKGIVETSPHSENSAAAEIGQITLDGFVRRSSGKSTTWINQQPQSEQQASTDIVVLQQLGKPPSIPMQLRSGQKLRLKAGQTFDAGTGTIIEAYQAQPAATTASPGSAQAPLDGQ